MDYITIVIRWIHILSAITLVGGTIFARFVLMPSAHSTLDDDTREKLHAQVMSRWRKLAHSAIGMLLLTGGFNFYLAIAAKVPPMPYHPIFGAKVLLALAAFFLAIALMSKGPGFAALRANSRKWANMLVTLGIVIVMLSGVLRHFALAAP